MKPIIKSLSNKRGGVLVAFAVALIVMMGMAGLALDVAHLYGVKSQLQVAADAAALAGANALTGSTPDVSAKAAATAVGDANYADADAGGAKPVALQSSDITCGNWDGTTFTTSNPHNAVRVVARRTSQNFLVKVLSLLPGGGSFDQTSVSAAAIAQRTKLPILPLAVNEYWNNSYPNSYMRGTNVDLSKGWAGKTFAVGGANANGNCGGGNDKNALVCLDYRCNQYDGNGLWFSASSTGSGGCSDTLSSLGGAPKNGSVNNQKNTYKGYLLTGIPDGLVPANAVLEPNIKPADYCSNNASYYVKNLNSQRPYATIPRISSSGNLDPAFSSQWPIGSKFIVMVYDGDTGNSGGLQFLTVVGYGIIQVDGYQNGGNVPPPFKNSGNTVYGHVIKHGISGQADKYLIQPSAANPTPACSDFLATIFPELEQKFPVAKLVDSNDSVMHYGIAKH